MGQSMVVEWKRRVAENIKENVALLSDAHHWGPSASRSVIDGGMCSIALNGVGHCLARPMELAGDLRWSKTGEMESNDLASFRWASDCHIAICIKFLLPSVILIGRCCSTQSFLLHNGVIVAVELNMSARYDGM
jgi:hypothetical protein